MVPKPHGTQRYISISIFEFTGTQIERCAGVSSNSGLSCSNPREEILKCVYTSAFFREKRESHVMIGSQIQSIKSLTPKNRCHPPLCRRRSLPASPHALSSLGKKSKPDKP